MRKYKKGRKLSRKRNQRKALLKSLAGNLFLKEKIKTTKAKAKEIAGFSEKLITKAKKGDLSSKRLLGALLTKKIAKKLVDEIAPRYKDRKGGYTRLYNLGKYKDGTAKVRLELV